MEYDHWAELGNSGWDWEGLLPYFKKSEHFAPADEEEIEEWGVGYEADAHGEGGFVQNGFSKFFWPSTSKFPSLLQHGISALQIVKLISTQEASYTPSSNSESLFSKTRSPVSTLAYTFFSFPLPPPPKNGVHLNPSSLLHLTLHFDLTFISCHLTR